MRIIIILILLVANLFVFIQSASQTLSIDNLSLRILLVALTLVLSTFFLLLRSNKVATYLAIVTLIFSLIHIIYIAHTAYEYIY